VLRRPSLSSINEPSKHPAGKSGFAFGLLINLANLELARFSVFEIDNGEEV
jgi:hypothetical protein